MLAFRTPDNQINLFRPQKHARRLMHSSSFVSLPSVPESHFIACVNLAVLSNSAFVPPHDSNALLYIRPLLFGSSAQLALSPPDEFTFCVYVTPSSAYHGVSALDALIMEDFDRAAPCGTGSAKVGGNYAPVIRWTDAAKREGYGITLHLDSKTRTEIDEFSTSGFIGIKHGRNETTLVVPDSPNVIDSVTSDSCMTLGKTLGWTVEKRKVNASMS
jgi:branched-chain amino acid aminotransferase